MRSHFRDALLLPCVGIVDGLGFVVEDHGWDSSRGERRQRGPRSYGKTRDGVSCSVLRKVAAPWGRGDLSAVTSGYSISGFAISRPQAQRRPSREFDDQSLARFRLILA